MTKMIFSIITVFSILIASGCTKKNGLAKKLGEQFNLRLNIDTSTTEFEKEQWDDNGDGYYIGAFTGLDEKDIKKILGQKQFQQLPLKKSLPEHELLPNLKIPEKGYYLFEYLDDDRRNFKIIFIDTANKKLLSIIRLCKLYITELEI